MSCKKYKTLIKMSLSGELSTTDREKLDAHLSSCPECNALVKIHSALDQAELSAPLPEKNEFSQMRARVLNKIRHEKQQNAEFDFSALWQKIRTILKKFRMIK